MSRNDPSGKPLPPTPAQARAQYYRDHMPVEYAPVQFCPDDLEMIESRDMPVRHFRTLSEFEEAELLRLGLMVDGVAAHNDEVMPAEETWHDRPSML
jgi:hypothetical protein